MDDKKMSIDDFSDELDSLLKKYNVHAKLCCFVFDAKEDENGTIVGQGHVSAKGKVRELIQMLFDEIYCMAGNDPIKALKLEGLFDRDFTNILAAKAAEQFFGK